MTQEIVSISSRGGLELVRVLFFGSWPLTGELLVKVLLREHHLRLNKAVVEFIYNA